MYKETEEQIKERKLAIEDVILNNFVHNNLYAKKAYYSN